MSGSQPVHKHSRTLSARGVGYPRGGSYIYRVNDEIIKVMSEFEVLIEKVAQRLAKNYRPHRATLNKLYAYPIDPAFREHRLKARTMELGPRPSQ
jgi:hypothetical protein